MNAPTPGQVVRRARRAAGMTQSELGRRIGSCNKTISLLEHDGYPVRNVAMLRAVARALGVAPERLGLASQATSTHAELAAAINTMMRMLRAITATLPVDDQLKVYR